MFQKRSFFFVVWSDYALVKGSILCGCSSPTLTCSLRICFKSIDIDTLEFPFHSQIDEAQKVWNGWVDFQVETRLFKPNQEKCCTAWVDGTEHLLQLKDWQRKTNPDLILLASVYSNVIQMKLTNYNYQLRLAI